MEAVPEFLRELEQRNRTEWMLVGMAFIRSVTITHAEIQDAVDKRLLNGMSVEKLVGDSFARLLKLALGLGVITARQYDALMFLGRLRNRWAHERDMEVELRDIGPLEGLLSEKRRASLKEHKDTVWGHFRCTVDLICDQMHKDLKGGNGEK